MSKLFFRFGAMNSGKSTALLQVAHNYEERDQSVILVKPAIDTKGKTYVVSRLGVSRQVDILLGPSENLKEAVATRQALHPKEAKPIACILIDEAQFLTPAQVDQALEVAIYLHLPVIAYGLRTDFRTQSFPGSQRLLEVAHTLEEMKTICRCGRKALFNARLINTGKTKEGSQVMIDEGNVRYEAQCAECYLA